MLEGMAKVRTIAEGADLERHLAEGPLLPVYLVCTADAGGRGRPTETPPAADPWALLAVARQIEATALRGGDPSLDLVRIDYIDGDHAGDGVHALMANEARSMSLFGGRRVVNVSHCEGLDYGAGGKRKKDTGDDPLEKLVDGLPDGGPPPFVLILSASRFDRRKKAYKDLAEKGAVVEVRPMDAAQLGRYLEEAAAPFEIRVDRAVAQRIWDRLGGGEPARLRQTVDRLLLDVGPRGHVTVELVEDVVPIDREAAVWAITDAIADADVGRGLGVLHLLIEHGQEPIAIGAFIASSVRSQLRVASLLAAGLRDDAIAGELGMHPYRAKQLVRQVSARRPEHLRAALETCATLDRVLRSTAIGDRKAATARWLETAIVALCHGRPMRRPVMSSALGASA